MTAKDRDDPGSRSYEPPRRLVVAVVSGTLLNALNSSMIAVALLSIQSAFGINTTSGTWLISAFYLAGAIGYALLGRLADQFGPRRVFCLGVLLAGVTGALAPLSPTFSWLVALRVLQAFGTCSAYPAGLAIFRARDPLGRTPANALGAVSLGSSVSAALGPVLGGFLVVLAGWPGIFLVNIPIVLLSLAMALRWLPADSPYRSAPTGARGGRSSAIPGILLKLDLPGVFLFSITVASLLGFLLSLSSLPMWPLLPLTPLAAALLVLHERRAAAPFLDVRMLASNRRLVSVYAQYATVNVVFYAVFFGLPLWLQQVRGLDPGSVGLLLLPMTLAAILGTPVAARLIKAYGHRPCLIIGYVALLAGSLLLLLFEAATPVPVLLAAGLILGIPNGFTNLGLMAALYESAPADQMGAASGQFQTSRYLGAILSTAVLGLVFGTGATSPGLHTIAYVIATVSVLLILVSVKAGRSLRTAG